MRTRRVEQPVGASLGDRSDLCGGDGQEVAREPDRGAMEIAAGLDAPVGQHHRIVDRRVQLVGRHAPSMLQRVPRRAGHLRRAAQRVGILNPRIPVSGGWPRSRSRRAATGGSPRWPPDRAVAAAPRAQRRTRGRCRAGASTDMAAVTSATRSSRVRSSQARHEHAEHPVGAVDQGQTLLGGQASAARCRHRRARPRPNAEHRRDRAPHPRPISASAQWASGARSPLAPSDPYSGTRGRDARR